MFGMAREPQARTFKRLRRDVNTLFERFFQREQWMPTEAAEPVRTLQRDLDRVLSESENADWSGVAQGEQDRSSWPRCEAVVADGAYLIRAEVPNFTLEDIQITLSELSSKSPQVDFPCLWTANMLTIRGERPSGSDGKAGAGRRRFSRTFTLPEPVEPEKVTASLVNGILEVRLPASPGLAGTQIPIRTGRGESSPKPLEAA